MSYAKQATHNMQLIANVSKVRKGLKPLITHVHTEHRYPLTHPQKRIWYTEQLNPGTTIHHLCGIGHIHGEVDVKLLQQALCRVTAEHEAFQIVVIEDESGPVQMVSSHCNQMPGYTDFSEQDDADVAFDAWLHDRLRQPLPLEHEPLYRFDIYKRAQGHYGIFAKLHHLIFDGWSTQLLTAEICRHYEQLSQSTLALEWTQEKSLAQRTYTYMNLLEREQEYMQSSRFEKDRSYWNAKFESIPKSIFPEQTHSLEARKYARTLSVTNTASIRQWVHEQHCSLNDYFVLLMGLYAGTMYNRDEVAFGLPVYNRSSTEDKQIIGMFTSTMPVLCSIQSEWTITETMKRLQKEIRRSFVHQKYPFDRLVQDLQLKNGEQHPLFQISVNYYPFIPTEQLLEQPFQVVEIHSGQQHVPLQLVIKEWEDDRLTLELDYQVEQFGDYEIQLMMDRLCFISEQMTAYPHMQVKQLSIITNTEQQMLAVFNDTAKDYDLDVTVLQLFQQQVRLFPHRTALSMDQTKWTYAQLYERMIQLTQHLSQLGIGSGDRVGIYGVHSMEIVASLLAIMNTGAAYVPMDCDYPVQRINDIVEDSGLQCIVLNQQLPIDTRYDGMLFWLDQDEIEETDPNRLNTVSRVTGESANSHIGSPIAQLDDLAYMIYTSGSTGKPKGVMIRHSNLVHYCHWANDVYPKQRPAVFALYSSLAFDLTITSLFTPLIGGHEIRIYGESKHDFVLFDILRDNRATVLKLTPAHLSLLREGELADSQLETLIVGGENLKTSLAREVCRQFDHPIHLYNEYGPTEATVGCMIHEYSLEQDQAVSVPIGKPAANVQLHVLDEQLQPVPAGRIGELFIAGTGVASGYWNQEERTAASFVPDPFNPHRNMYRTGDLVRFVAAGQMEYMGRKDRQTKINGYRIELEEIEAVLLRHPCVQQAVVIERQASQPAFIEMQNEQSEKAVLCGYIVLNSQLDIQQLQSYLLSALPAYMVPRRMIILERIPLTVNGKVDVNALPVPSIEQADTIASVVVEPVVEEQRLLQDMLTAVLHTEMILPTHNFFELGGDSIKAIQVSSRLKANGYTLKAKDILAYPIVSDMANHLVKDTHSTLEVEASVTGMLGMPPIHEWFWAQSFARPDYYHQSLLLQLDQQITPDRARAGLQTVIERHDAFRLNLNEQRQLYYNLRQEEDVQFLQVIDLSELSADEQKKQIDQSAVQLKSSFNLYSDLLFQAIYYELGSQGKRLLLVAHHLVIDGVSWRIVLEDLAECWIAQQEQRELQLPAKTNSYQQWSAAIENYRLQLEDEQLRYWQQLSEPYLLAERDAATYSQKTMAETWTMTTELDTNQTKRWLLEANTAYQTQPLDLLLIALAYAIQQVTNRTELLLELEGHGREEFNSTIDISRTVGWFTSIYPVGIRLSETDLKQQIKEVKEQLRQVPDKGFPYLIGRYIQPALLAALPTDRMIRVNYLGDLDGFAVEGLFDLAEESTGADVGPENTFTVDMDIQAMIRKGRLCLSVTCAHYSKEQIQTLLQNWQERLALIVEHCINQDNIVYTPTDFDTIRLDQDELDSLFAD